jgi:hypothetical protein
MGGGTGIVVETRYRVTVDGTMLDLDEETAQRLVADLGARLGFVELLPPEVGSARLTPVPVQPVAALPAAVDPPAKSPPGEWTDADTDRLRTLAAEGMDGKRIADAMGRKPHVIYYRAGKYKITLGLPSAATEDAASPERPAAKPGPDDWTPEETKALIATIAGGRGLREAMTATGHTFLSCSRRWTHLKEAGLMTIGRYVASQESTREDG